MSCLSPFRPICAHLYLEPATPQPRYLLPTVVNLLIHLLDNFFFSMMLALGRSRRDVSSDFLWTRVGYQRDRSMAYLPRFILIWWISAKVLFDLFSSSPMVTLLPPARTTPLADSLTLGPTKNWPCTRTITSFVASHL